MHLENCIMKNQYCLLLFSLFLVFSCKKETPVVPVTTIPESIGMGIKEGMQVVGMDTFLTSGIFQTNSLKIDVNTDGIPDLTYILSIDGSSSAGFAGVHKLRVLHKNIAFIGTPYHDTTYIHLDTSIVYPGGPSVEISMHKWFGYTRLSPLDDVFSINNYPFKAKAFAPFDRIKQSDTYDTSMVELMNYNIGHRIMSTTVHDTTFIHYSNSPVNKNPFPSGKGMYLGFRLNDNGIIRLGWIEFNMVQDGAVHIFETAIQK